ncbi:MAG: DUF262 domain-containing protein, partial [Clostridia bacterium]|nr:DUF262 domain-containing protein [Clostridia bacterium]
KETVLSPKFQRRPVWEYKAKSYLIDSILSGLPIPRVFIRERTNVDMTSCREIIDGQQRLKTIFDFINDGFKVSKVHNKEFGGLCYSELPDEVKKDFLKYPISAILLIDLDDNAVFDIFARLNTYSVKLNNQELLNSQYFGVYKQLVYRLAQEYRSFWVEAGILSEKAISRMEDAKLVSELLSVIVEGNIISNNFEQCKKIYSKYDDSFEDAEQIERQFKQTLDLFSKIYPDDFSETAYAKAPLFYSAFIALFHMNNPIQVFGNSAHSVDENSISKIRTVFDEIASIVAEPIEVLEKDEADFVLTLKKNTTTPDVRTRRCKYIINKLMSGLE